MVQAEEARVGFEGAVEERRGEACGADGTGRDGVEQWTLTETLVLLAQGAKRKKTTKPIQCHRRW